MSVAPEALRTTALQLLLTAERLIALHGTEGVSLRQIAAEAGSSNNSAIRYHFGSKEGMLSAVLAYRLDDLTHRRTLLRSRADPDDLRARLEAHLVPLVELAEVPGSYYVSFVEQLQRSAASVLVDQLPEVQKSKQDFRTDVGRFVADIPQPARSMRVSQVQDLVLHTAAERERAMNRGDTATPFPLFVSTAVDGLAGLLSAPASKETLRLIERKASR